MYRKDKKDEFYTRKANKEGFVARSVYKLQEIDEKYHIFHKGDTVLDLGAAPGSWMQYMASRVGQNGFIQGIDIQNLQIQLTSNMAFSKIDLLDYNPAKRVYDVVVSDAAPFTSGVPSLDAGRSLELASKALEVATNVLKPGGIFVTKIFEGEQINDFHKNTEKSFALVKRYRPKAITKQSRELYLIAKGFAH